MRRPIKFAATALMTVGLLAGDLAHLSFSPAPAEARWRGGGFGYGVTYPIGRYGYGYGYRHHDDIDAGDVIAVVAVVAGVAALASAARDRNRDRGYDNGGWDDGGWDRRSNRGWDDRRGSSGRDSSSRDRREDIAIGECRAEAERQARTYGTSASLRDIYDVDSQGNAVRIRGLVEIARSEAVPGGTERRLTTEPFTCVVRGGLVESYQLGDGFASRY